MPVRPHVVIVGSGFGGLSAAEKLAGQPVEVTVVDRDNYHGFWPLLYQVATAGLGADDIARPIRAIHSPHPNVSVRLGSVGGIDLDRRRVLVEGGPDLAYDYLILAAGSSTTDFGIPGVTEHAFPLKTIPDALRLRNHVLAEFERADARAAAGTGPAPDAGSGDEEISFVLIGGGPTGVEMAGALSELIAHTLASDFPRLDLSRARIVVVEMTDHLLPGFSERSQKRALETLAARGVEVRLNTRLAEVTAGGVRFEDGTGISSSTVVWTAGVRANPLSEHLPGPKGKGGTVPVEEDLSLPGHPEVFVIGDLAAATNRQGDQLPQLAQVAIQGGKRAADNIGRRLAGKPPRPFRYHDHGIMATIGRRQAVAELPGGIAFGGTLGWLAWLAVHLVFLVGFRNRVVVMVNWAWNYLTWDRASRVILDEGSTTPSGQTRA
ncbi:MAG TPA: NAD(P)/FAD-dependent oxidoreductase [Acidimicrobiales bacterium]|nr:NAD(P)/FAD-dependent oxidoreductase [Acidimicrobiales bacterium]